MMRDSWLVLLTQLQTEMTAVPKFPLLIQICSVLQFVLMLPILWIGVVAVLGLTRRKKDFPLVRKINRFAIVVCARNEEAALPSLLESIRRITCMFICLRITARTGLRRSEENILLSLSMREKAGRQPERAQS